MHRAAIEEHFKTKCGKQGDFLLSLSMLGKVYEREYIQ